MPELHWFLFVLFDFKSQSTIFQLCRDGSSWVEYKLIKITGPDPIKMNDVQKLQKARCDMEHYRT